MQYRWNYRLYYTLKWNDGCKLTRAAKMTTIWSNISSVFIDSSDFILSNSFILLLTCSILFRAFATCFVLLSSASENAFSDLRNGGITTDTPLSRRSSWMLNPQSVHRIAPLSNKSVNRDLLTSSFLTQMTQFLLVYVPPNILLYFFPCTVNIYLTVSFCQWRYRHLGTVDDFSEMYFFKHAG